jgi:putative ABC transport system ATP-binding protein
MDKIDVTALKNINLKIDKGQFLAIAGPSGSGKTTLLNIMGCLDTPTHGEIIFDEQNLATLSFKGKMNIRRHKIGFIFQSFNLIPVLNVYENVEYPLLLNNTKTIQRRELVLKVLEEVGLLQRAKHFPNELSGGERQRVSIARALVKKPMIILADEPTANLDSTTGANIISLMQKLHQEEQVTFVFSSHDDRILKKAEEVIQLQDGSINQ